MYCDDFYNCVLPEGVLNMYNFIIGQANIIMNKYINQPVHPSANQINWVDKTEHMNEVPK